METFRENVKRITDEPPQLLVNVVAFSLCGNKLQVMLTPYENKFDDTTWRIPRTVVIKGISPENLAIDLMEKHLGTRDVFVEQLYTYGEPDRYQDEHVISIVYFSLIPAQDVENEECRLVKDGKWFPVAELPMMGNNDSEIIDYALRRLRYKLEYSAVGFQLLPEEFTLSAIQHTYEIILGEKLDKRNFRRRILEAEIIEPTPRLKTGEGRPARLYRYRPDAVAEVKARRLFP